jgi:hypothetical protein
MTMLDEAFLENKSARLGTTSSGKDRRRPGKRMVVPTGFEPVFEP